MTHESKITAKAGAERGKIEFTQRGRQPRGVITHVKVPFYVRGPVSDLEVNPEGLAYRSQDLKQRNTRARGQIERPAGLARDQAFDHTAKIGSKNVISQDRAIA